MKSLAMIGLAALMLGTMLGAGIATNTKDRPAGYDHWTPAQKIYWLEDKLDKVEAENRRIKAMLTPSQQATVAAATAPKPDIPQVGMTMAELREWAGPNADVAISLISQTKDATTYRVYDWEVTFGADGKISSTYRWRER